MRTTTTKIQCFSFIQEFSFINLTPHLIVVDLREVHGGEHIIEPSGYLARLKEYSGPSRLFGVSWISGFRTGEVEIQGDGEQTWSWPEFRDLHDLGGVQPIVSMAVLSAAPGEVFVAPDTGPTAIRNERGQIQAVRGFRVWSELVSEEGQ